MTTPSVTGQVVTLGLRAVASDWAGLFDHIEVWRSTVGQDGPYYEMTADTWAPPTFPSDLYGISPPSPPITGKGVPIVGLTLELLKDEETPIVITFTGTNNLTLQQAATQIVSQGKGALASFVSPDGRLVLTGEEPGNGAILRITGGDAAPLLGLPTTDPDDYAYGKDARIELVSGQDTYQFTDQHGDPSYFYKTRFRQFSSGNVSDFSLPFSASNTTVVDNSTLILGTVDLVDAQGRPVINRQVTITVKFGGTTTSAGQGVVPRDISLLTDSNGHAEFSLLRGLLIQVAIAGTQLVRDVAVPTDPALTNFSLLDPSVGSNDLFTVQVPDIDFAVRRSL